MLSKVGWERLATAFVVVAVIAGVRLLFPGADSPFNFGFTKTESRLAPHTQAIGQDRLAGLYYLPADNDIFFATLFIYPGKHTREFPIGMGHLVEHLAAMRVLGLNQEEQGLNGRSAQTGHFSISYQVVGQRENAQEILRTFAKLFKQSDWNQADLDREIAIVTQERRRNEDQGHRPDLYELKAIFGEQTKILPLSWPSDQVPKITLGQTRKFFARTHQNERAVLYVFTNISPQRVEGMVKAAFSEPLVGDHVQYRATLGPRGGVKFDLDGPEEIVTTRVDRHQEFRSVNIQRQQVATVGTDAAEKLAYAHLVTSIIEQWLKSAPQTAFLQSDVNVLASDFSVAQVAGDLVTYDWSLTLTDEANIETYQKKLTEIADAVHLGSLTIEQAKFKEHVKSLTEQFEAEQDDAQANINMSINMLQQQYWPVDVPSLINAIGDATLEDVNRFYTSGQSTARITNMTILPK